MKKLIPHLPKAVSYFFILLFCYAAISKAMDFENFQVQIGQSPLLSAYAGWVSYTVIIIEIVVVFFLSLDKLRQSGLYFSTALMTAFTVYIFLILNYSDFVPCSCGGILEDLGWTEHLIFNVCCVMLGGISVLINAKTFKAIYKRSVAYLVISNITAILLVTTLFLKSEYIIKQENNFTRRFLMHPLIKTTVRDMETSSLYFAGVSDGKIFLGDHNLPQHLISADSSLTEIKRFKIQLDLKEHTFKKIEIKVSNGYYYIYDGTIPIIIKGKLGDNENWPISNNDVFFNQLEIINDTQFAFRTQSAKTKNLMLGQLIITKTGKNTVRLFPQLLERQYDGVFDSDGHLSTDQKRGVVSYIYSYRNQFLVMDSVMQLKNKMRTIDTIQRAQIKTRTLSDGRNKMEKPPLKVNGQATPFLGLLFNPSELRGKNESKRRWKNNKVIDIYRTDKQEYIGSLYIEKLKEETLSDFLITEKDFYALVGHQLIRYRITNSLQKHFQKRGSRKP